MLWHEFNFASFFLQFIHNKNWNMYVVESEQVSVFFFSLLEALRCLCLKFQNGFIEIGQDIRKGPKCWLSFWMSPYLVVLLKCETKPRAESLLSSPSIIDQTQTWNPYPKFYMPSALKTRPMLWQTKWGTQASTIWSWNGHFSHFYVHQLFSADTTIYSYTALTAQSA